MEIDEKTVILYRKKHPNCLYCKYCRNTKYLYQCGVTEKKFAFNTKRRAAKCEHYKVLLSDLKTAVRAFKHAKEIGAINIDI